MATFSCDPELNRFRFKLFAMTEEATRASVGSSCAEITPFVLGARRQIKDGVPRQSTLIEPHGHGAHLHVEYVEVVLKA